MISKLHASEAQVIIEMIASETTSKKHEQQWTKITSKFLILTFFAQIFTFFLCLENSLSNQ